MLLGVAIRTGSPLSLSLAEPVWKQLAGMSLTIADLSEVTWGCRRGKGPLGSATSHGWPEVLARSQAAGLWGAVPCAPGVCSARRAVALRSAGTCAREGPAPSPIRGCCSFAGLFYGLLEAPTLPLRRLHVLARATWWWPCGCPGRPRLHVQAVSWALGCGDHPHQQTPFQVDKDFIPGLMYIRDNEATSEEFEAMSLPFTVPSASGQDIQLSTKYTHISLDNRAEYVRLAINYRCVATRPTVHLGEWQEQMRHAWWRRLFESVTRSKVLVDVASLAAYPWSSELTLCPGLEGSLLSSAVPAATGMASRVESPVLGTVPAVVPDLHAPLCHLSWGKVVSRPPLHLCGPHTSTGVQRLCGRSATSLLPPPDVPHSRSMSSGLTSRSPGWCRDEAPNVDWAWGGDGPGGLRAVLSPSPRPFPPGAQTRQQ